jgi:hypothetical protein
LAGPRDAAAPGHSLFAALQEAPRHLLDKQRHTAGALGDVIDDIA